MTPAQRNKLVASVIVAASEAGVKMESPYDLENLWEDVLRPHSELMDFFYRDEGEPIDAVAHARKILSS
jgi:hypothetical protein